MQREEFLGWNLLYSLNTECVTAENQTGSIRKVCANMEAAQDFVRRTEREISMLTPDWAPTYSPWRHGGWYVNSICYPNGAVGCVSNHWDDGKHEGKWRIVCDDRPADQRQTYPTRDAAARAERKIALEAHAAIKSREMEDA